MPIADDLPTVEMVRLANVEFLRSRTERSIGMSALEMLLSPHERTKRPHTDLD